MTSYNDAQVIIATHPEVHPAMVHAAVDVLNSALQADRRAVNLLCSTEVEVNDTLANHPTIQVSKRINTKTLAGSPEDFTMRPLGLINGLFGRSYGFIYVSTKDLDLPDGPPMDDWIDYLYAGPR